ncbi:MAG: DUF4270 domain-containing protein [Bacteroidales bacterium]|nr:DUF4270 domain-containing protein [Bacteroidales bacterium]
MKRLGLLLTSLLAGIFMVSCVNEDERLGLEFVGDKGAIDILAEENTNVTISAEVFSQDSLRTVASRGVLLGSYRDNNFGRVTSSIYTQVSLSTEEKNFLVAGTGDSVVLTLAYSGAFAKDKNVTSMNMHITVSEVMEEIDSSKTHANDDLAISPSPLFDGNVNVNIYDTNIILANDTMKYAPHMRLKLSNDFLSRIMSRRYESGEEFMQDFKGIKITASNTDASGMMVSVDLSASLSGMTVYYTTTSGHREKYKLNFPVSGRMFMHIDKDYSGSRLAGLNSKSTRKASIDAGEYISVAALGVAEAKLDLAGLKEWHQLDSLKGIAINRAELILPVADISGDPSTYPKSLVCYRKNQDNDSSFFFIKDEVIASYVNGTSYYDTTINAYRILLTSHLQAYLNGAYDGTDAEKNKKTTIYIMPNPRINSAARVVLNGPSYSDPARRPKLYITYSHTTTD